MTKSPLRGVGGRRSDRADREQTEESFGDPTPLPVPCSTPGHFSNGEFRSKEIPESRLLNYNGSGN